MTFEWLYLSQFIFILAAMFLAGYSKASKLPTSLVLLFICLALHGAFARLPFASETKLSTFSYAFAFMYGPLFYLSICKLLALQVNNIKSAAIAGVPPFLALLLITSETTSYMAMGALLLTIQLLSIAFSYRETIRYRNTYDQARAKGDIPAINWIRSALWVYLAINIILFLRALSGDNYVNDDSRLMNLLVSISIAIGLAYVVVKLNTYNDWIPKLSEEERFLPSVNNDKTAINVSPLVQELEAYIEKHRPHLDPEISVRKLAQDLGWPIKQVSMVINQHFGCSFSEKINQERVKEAKKLMTDSERLDRPLLDIAFESGFNSKASFNVMFKRHTNQTPRDYRKSLSHN